MRLPLYTDEVQARHVLATAQEALALPGPRQRSQKRAHLSIPIVAWTSAAFIHSTYQQQLRVRQQQEFQRQNLRLRQEACARVLEPCLINDIAIEVLGEYPLFAGLKLVRGTTTDVVIVPAEEDPLVIDGEFPLPEPVRRRLNAMQRAGVPFDMLYTYIAHEVPPHSVPARGPLTREAVAPRIPTTQVSERLGVIADALTRTFIGDLKTPTRGGLRDTAPMRTSLASTAASLLDPLIFGALADQRGMATWFVLAQWAW